MLTTDVLADFDFYLAQIYANGVRKGRFPINRYSATMEAIGWAVGRRVTPADLYRTICKEHSGYGPACLRLAVHRWKETQPELYAEYSILGLKFPDIETSRLIRGVYLSCFPRQMISLRWRHIILEPGQQGFAIKTKYTRSGHDRSMPLYWFEGPEIVTGIDHLFAWSFPDGKIDESRPMFPDTLGGNGPMLADRIYCEMDWCEIYGLSEDSAM